MAGSPKQAEPRIPFYKRPWGIALIVAVVLFAIIVFVFMD